MISTRARALNFAKEIKSEIIQEQYNLYKSFFLNAKYSRDLKNFKKINKFSTIVVIGMGGSILGVKAIYSFLKHKIKKKFIFVDNLDENFLKDIKCKNKLNKSLFLIISKSGNTSETILNSSYFKSFFNKSNVIIITENRNNILNNYAKSKGYTFIEHNAFIGGRYSVFSDVGMFPAYLMGLNLDNFKKNSKNFLNNDKNLSKFILDLEKSNIYKSRIVIFFNYVPELNDFLYWCQQLLAESLGKNKKGFIPVISSAPKDHHSLLQLYLDGPKDKVFYIFSLNKKSKLKVSCKSFGKETNFLDKKKYHKIKESQKKSFIQILKKKKNSYREIVIQNIDENTLGKLFLNFIFETISLAKMMKINPYNQPAVEDVKILTKKYLKSKKTTKKNS